MTLILFIVFFFIQCSRQWFLFKLTIFIILFCVLLIVSRLFAIISHFLQQLKKKIASYRDSFAFICESYALSFESYAFIRSFYYLRKWLQWAFVSLRISAQNKKKLHQNCLFFYIHELTIFADINYYEIKIRK